jgi:hypothetical protein
MNVHSLDDEIRALYAGPLDSFVGVRQALAKRLREARDVREAEVRGLRKPSVSAWAVNHLFARQPHEMVALLDAGQRARTVQRSAPTRGEGKSLREWIAAVRAALPRLVALGSQALAATGRAPGEAIVERLRNNLEALALDSAQSAIAARRWLDEDLPRPGFEVMAALQLGASAPASATLQQPSGAAGKGLERRERIEQLRRELAFAERASAERTKAAAIAAENLERAEQEAADARARAAETQRAASDAERAATRARAALERSERE